MKNKWISVKERLPEASNFYLVCTSPTAFEWQLNRCVLYFSKSDGEWWTNGAVVSNVRYWRKLPNSPEVTCGYTEKDI